MESQTELKILNPPLWLPHFLSYRPETALTTVQMYLNSTVLFVFHSPICKMGCLGFPQLGRPKGAYVRAAEAGSTPLDNHSP